jgi:hypothetical protein
MDELLVWFLPATLVSKVILLLTPPVRNGPNGHAFATDNEISLSCINDLKGNADVMNIVAAACPPAAQVCHYYVPDVGYGSDHGG